MAHRRSLGFPGFPVEGCGFEQLHVVLFEENHISGTGESCEVGNPSTLGMTKRRGLLKGKDRCQGIGHLLGGEDAFSQEHLPTIIAGVPSATLGTGDGFVGGLKYSWLDMQKTRKDRKSYRLSG
jgi:hypothetical protein